MPLFLWKIWDSILWHLAWYANGLYELWINISPLGYVSICFAAMGVGYVFLKSGTKQFGR